MTDLGCDGQGVTGEDKADIDAAQKAIERNQFTSWEKAKKEIDKPKRGKDIKCFADLHPGIQQSIDKMSLVDGKIDQTIKANRTAIAIDYQHKHPDRYHPTGAVFTGNMTVMERLFYRPGQRNFVSLPGRACHGVH